MITSTVFEYVLEFTRKPPAYEDVSVIELQGVPSHRFTVHSEKMLRTENCKPGSKVCLNRGRYLSSVTADSPLYPRAAALSPPFGVHPYIHMVLRGQRMRVDSLLPSYHVGSRD